MPVTGHADDDRSVFVDDAEVEAVAVGGGVEVAQLWSADGPSTFPGSGINPGAPDFFPPVGGYRFVIATVPTEYPSDAEFSPEGVDEVMGDKPGFHTTDSTDFEVILSGQVALELDDGAEVILLPGDVVVQNGIRHRWRSVGDEVASMAVFMVGAHRRGAGA